MTTPPPPSPAQHPSEPPSSPGDSPTSIPPHPLADIFPDSPPRTPPLSSPPSHPPLSAHPSDIPRLRATHATAGYRSGISAAKSASLQPGFDEGYSLGAVLGLRVGYVLGVLEGLWAAFAKAVNGAQGIGGEQEEKALWVAEKERLGGVLMEARGELVMERVFGKEWWAGDGVWRFEVEGDGGAGFDGGDATFEKVAEQHPLLEKWSLRVREEMRRLGVQEGTFEGEEWESGRVTDYGGGEPATRNDDGSSPRIEDVEMGASSDSHWT